MIGERHEHQVAAGQGDVAGQTGALGTDGFLGDLHEDVLALADEFVDHRRRGQVAGRVLVQLVAGRQPLVAFRVEVLGLLHVEEAGALQADVDKGRVDARQHPHHPAQVDVADQPAFGEPVQVEFAQVAVFHQGDPVLVEGGIDEDVCVHNGA